jgi:Fic family protein
MAAYIHERPDWPRIRWNAKAIGERLARVRHRQGRLIGRMEGLSFLLRAEAVLRTLTEETVKSSAIEGENLDAAQVRSSIARRLGIDIGALAPVDRDVEGVVEMILDATQRFDAPLTAEQLFGWHASLFPTGRSGLSRIAAGRWRDDRTGPMQVVSGPIGRERVHFQAPPAANLEREMSAFLTWFETPKTIDPVVAAALAHFWFLTIHPFDDGNGRIARAIADMALARSDQSALRFYSMSAQLRAERQAYYDALESAQKDTLDVTDWLVWFLECLARALDGAKHILGAVLVKARFWETHADGDFNARQRALLNRLLDGFVGKLTTSKWAKIAKCSQDTALRDIDDLTKGGILVREAAGGRSTSYTLAPLGE